MKALIIDDERLARAELRRLLEKHPDVEIVGEARDAEDALSPNRSDGAGAFVSGYPDARRQRV